jgi:hypothetical protein
MNNIDPSLIDPLCIEAGLNPNLFPVGSAQHLDMGLNILPFLCNLLNATNDDNITGILVAPPSSFDLTPFTDFTGLTAVGDPRVSLGEVMIQTGIKFIPKMIAQTEVRQNGGTQIIDNYICNSDGVTIKKSESVPVLLSLDLTGQTPYQYGAITIPPLSTTYEELLTPFIPQDITDFVNGYMISAKEAHAGYFVSFIKKYFSGYTPTINIYKTFGIMLVILTKGTTTVYIKYYSDVANKIGVLLGLEEIKYIIGNKPPTNGAISLAISSEIPNYKNIFSNDILSKDQYDLIMSKYKTTPELDYTYILSNSALAIKYFSDTYGTLNTPSVSSVPVVYTSVTTIGGIVV